MASSLSGGQPKERSEQDDPKMAQAVAADAGLLLQAVRTAPWADPFAHNMAAGQYERLLAAAADRSRLQEENERLRREGPQRVYHEPTRGTGCCPRCGSSMTGPNDWVTTYPELVNCAAASSGGSR